MSDQTDLNALVERVENGSGADNALDVLIEVALFKPNSVYAVVRSNAAGTKVIYTDHVGNQVTCWSEDWTMDRVATAAALRARMEAGG